LKREATAGTFKFHHMYKFVPVIWALFKISYEDKYNLPMNKEFLSKEKIKHQKPLMYPPL
jgi:hypothetical protein